MAAQNKQFPDLYWKSTGYRDADELLKTVQTLGILNKKIEQVDLLGYSCNLFVENARRDSGSEAANGLQNPCFPYEFWTNGLVRIAFEDKSTFEIRPMNGISGRMAEIGRNQFTDGRLQKIGSHILGRAPIFSGKPGFWLYNFIIGDVAATYEEPKKSPQSFYDYEGRKCILQFRNMEGVFYNLVIDFYYRCGLFYRVLLSYASSANIPIFADHKSSLAMFENEAPIPVLRGCGTLGYYTFYDGKFEDDDEFKQFDNSAISIFNHDYKLLLAPFIKPLRDEEGAAVHLDDIGERAVGPYKVVEKSLGLVPNTIPSNIIMDYDFYTADISVWKQAYSFKDIREMLVKMEKECEILEKEPASASIFNNIYKYIIHKKGLPQEADREKFAAENSAEFVRIIGFYQRFAERMDKLMVGKDGTESVTIVGRVPADCAEPL